MGQVLKRATKLFMQKKEEEYLLIKAARGEKTERVPVWMMRQAGRILPEYRAIRAKMNGFKEMVTNPSLAAEITLQPVQRFDVDAAIIFSDILVIPEAMGLPYEMIEGKGPRFPEVVRSEEDIKRLRTAIGDALDYVHEAIAYTVRALGGKKPLIGFAGAPFTIFCYMVEGQGSKTFSVAKRLMYQRPDLAHALFDKITQATITYLKAQIEAGASLVQVFDSWAGILSPQQFQEFALPAIAQICEAIQEVPITVFAKGAWSSLEALNKLNCEVISLDWQTPPGHARSIIQGKSLQGNLDPCVLYADEQRIESETKAMLDSFGTQGYIANLGHGLYPDIDYRKVQVFVDTVKSYKA